MAKSRIPTVRVTGIHVANEQVWVTGWIHGPQDAWVQTFQTRLKDVTIDPEASGVIHAMWEQQYRETGDYEPGLPLDWGV